jgi:hypothetical protein
MSQGADYRDLPPGSDERLAVAFASVAAASEPGAVISDWGDYNQDYAPAQHHEAWGLGGVEGFYTDSAAPEAVMPTNLSEEESDAVESNNQSFWGKLW